MQLHAATKPTDANFVQIIREKVQSIKVVTKDSIGICSSESNIYLLKLPAPPRAALLVSHVFSCLFAGVMS